MAALQAKNNKLQTDVENAKNATSIAQKKAAEAAQAQSGAGERAAVLQKTVAAKEEDVNCHRIARDQQREAADGLRKEVADRDAKM